MNEQMTYGVIQGLPKEVEPAVRLRNYAFFELRWNKRTYNDKERMGPFIVTARENTETGVLRLNWFTKTDNTLRFVADDNQIATAWMVDDINWHNRLYLLDESDRRDPAYRLINYHTRNGTYAADYINMEIQCMREVLKDMVPVVEVVRNGEYYDFFYDEAKADKFIADQAKIVTKISKEGVLTESKHEADYTTRDGRRFEYRPEIAALIAQYKRIPYGWTNCAEFMNQIKPKIVAMIKERRAVAPVAQAAISKESLMNGLRELTLEERQELLGIIPETKQPEAAIPEGEGPAPTHVEPEAPAAPEAPKHKGGKGKPRTAGVPKKETAGVNN